MLKQYFKINKQLVYNVKEAHYVINNSYSIQKTSSLWKWELPRL